MRPADIALLYRYNYWAQERILRQVERLTPEQYLADAGYSWGGVGGTLAHILGTEVAWRARWQGQPTTALTQPDLGTADAFMAAWAENVAAMWAYLDAVPADDLDRDFAYARGGQTYTHPLWTQLTHVVNHGTQHRSEIAAMLTNLGYSPGDIDFSLFMRERTS